MIATKVLPSVHLVTARDPRSATFFAALMTTFPGMTTSRSAYTGTILLAGGADLVARTAAMADACGLVVVESERGWTAVEPLRREWGSTPGACRIWTAGETGRSPDECDGAYLDWIAANEPRALLIAQGIGGWRLGPVRRAADGVLEAVYRHREGDGRPRA